MTALAAPKTQMAIETGEAPEIVQQQLAANQASCVQIAKHLRKNSPQVVVTCARGSSDHAATFAKYLIETKLGLITSSSAPSVSSVYKRGQLMANTLFIAISQSGQSPDIVENAKLAKQNGAYVVAMVNQADSPLASHSDVWLPLHAGPEISVAATKSFIASLSAICQLVAHWANDENLLQALELLPEHLRQGSELDWNEPLEAFSKANSLLVVGRGPGFGIAQESALKFKETSTLHAEAFSAAEIKHGPFALIQKDFPLLVYRQADESFDSVGKLVEELRQQGANVFVAETGTKQAGRLPIIAGMHPVTSLLVMVQSFYALANKVSLSRGLNPDSPQNLRKVTETV